MGFHGRTQVGFSLKDGVASNALVVTGSGMGLVDRAALQSVQNAHYPEPPVEWRGREQEFQVWVEYRP